MQFKNNLFISFEGPEASGKSSQINLLSKYLKKNKISHLITREPGGTKISEKLRKIILDKKEKISQTEEILMLMSARLNHINNVIGPALKNNKLVITDRFADSTFVYQGYVNDYGMIKAKKLHKQILNNFLPSKTFLFLLPSQMIKERLKKRKILNKYDKLNITFHDKVIQGYRILSKNNKRFVIIDASQSIDVVHNKIVNNLFNINE